MRKDPRGESREWERGENRRVFILSARTNSLEIHTILKEIHENASFREKIHNILKEFHENTPFRENVLGF